MKKTTTLLALALMAGAMVSCNNDDAPLANNDKVAVQLTGGINVTTRAANAN